MTQAQTQSEFQRSDRHKKTPRQDTNICTEGATYFLEGIVRCCRCAVKLLKGVSRHLRCTIKSALCPGPGASSRGPPAQPPGPRRRCAAGALRDAYASAAEQDRRRRPGAKQLGTASWARTLQQIQNVQSEISHTSRDASLQSSEVYAESSETGGFKFGIVCSAPLCAFAYPTAGSTRERGLPRPRPLSTRRGPGGRQPASRRRR